MGIISKPYFTNANSSISNVEIQKINLYLFEDVCFAPDSSNILSKDKLFIETLQWINIPISDYSIFFLKIHDEMTGLVQIGNKLLNLNIEAAYFLSRDGESNYFHWTIYILPMLEFIATSDGFSRCRHIIASSRVREINAF